MTIPFPSPTQQIQYLAADQALRDKYFDPATIEAGDMVEYRDMDDATDDRCWNDAERIMRNRGLRLDDNGSGYIAVTI